MRGDDAAAVRGEETGLEVEGAKKVAGRIGERDGDGPGDEFRGIGNAGGRKKLNGTIVHDAVDGTCGEPIPLGPPAASRMAHRFVGRVLEHELDVVDAGGRGVGAVRVGIGERIIHTNKVPARASGAGWQVRNEKEFVRAQSDGGGESGGCGS